MIATLGSLHPLARSWRIASRNPRPSIGQFDARPLVERLEDRVELVPECLSGCPSPAAPKLLWNGERADLIAFLYAGNDGIMRETASGAREIVVTILRVILGLAFLAIAAVKLAGASNTAEMFADIGWGQWFRYFTGALDLIGGVLVLLPRRAFIGALLLMCTVGLATVLTIAGRISDSAVPPLILTALAATLAWLTRPQRSNARASADLT